MAFHLAPLQPEPGDLDHGFDLIDLRVGPVESRREHDTGCNFPDAPQHRVTRPAFRGDHLQLCQVLANLFQTETLLPESADLLEAPDMFRAITSSRSSAARRGKKTTSDIETDAPRWNPRSRGQLLNGQRSISALATHRLLATLLSLEAYCRSDPAVARYAGHEWIDDRRKDGMTSRLLDSVPFLLVGVVHLLPLPGSPRATRDVARIRERARRDAEAYREGGAHALIIENFGDAPFRKDGVEPHVIALMALVVEEIRESTGLPVGVNVLRNDARAALGIAVATGASFMRVNVHVGAMVTDQGIIEGRADETLRYRALLQSETEIWADVLVKHAVPLAPLALEDTAEETVQRGLADALIVTGPMTGRAPDLAELSRVRERLPTTPVFVGSGVTADNVARYIHAARGAIVGTWAKVEGKIENPVDPARVQRLCQAITRALPH